MVQWYTSALFYHLSRGAHLEQDGTQAGQENSGAQVGRVAVRRRVTQGLGEVRARTRFPRAGAREGARET
jgi:hypothetical protein